MRTRGLVVGVIAAAFAVALMGCSSIRGGGDPPSVVQEVEIERYLGTWYEVASFPIRAQRGCVGTTATYRLRDDGDISVYNRCLEDRFDGEVKDIEGRAWVDDEETNAKLRVRFFWPLRSPYWIVGLDEDYQWALVSGPRRSNLWILSRDPCMDQGLFEELYRSLLDRGFEMEKLEGTPQMGEDGEVCEVDLGPVRGR